MPQSLSRKEPHRVHVRAGQLREHRGICGSRVHSEFHLAHHTADARWQVSLPVCECVCVVWCVMCDVTLRCNAWCMLRHMSDPMSALVPCVVSSYGLHLDTGPRFHPHSAVCCSVICCVVLSDTGPWTSNSSPWWWVSLGYYSEKSSRWGQTS